MVSFQSPRLDRTFSVLADATRRAILLRLSESPDLTISEIAQPFPVSLPNILKHIGVLAEAGLVTREKTGRIVRCRLVPGPLEEATQWLNYYEKFWSERLDALGRHLESDPCPTSKKPVSKSQASRSNVTTRRRSRRSTARGSTPRR